MQTIKSAIFFLLLINFLAACTSLTERPLSQAEKLGFAAGKKVLILHADDVGMCAEANTSTRRYLLEGDIQSAAVMPPAPDFEAFISWAKVHPHMDVGLHLTLTSEWRTYRWSTVSDPSLVPGLIDPEGKMWRTVAQVASHASAAEVEQEIRAQIEKSLALGFRPSHIDTHMGTLYARPDYLAVFLRLAEEYQIPANVVAMSNQAKDKAAVEKHREAGVPIDDEMLKLIENYSLPKLDNFESIGGGRTYASIRENFIALVDGLKPGLTEIIFHPSEPTQNLKTITNSWQQRGWEAQLFSDPELKAYFKAEGIVFTNWTDIMARWQAGLN